MLYASETVNLSSALYAISFNPPKPPSSNVSIPEILFIGVFIWFHIYAMNPETSFFTAAI